MLIAFINNKILILLKNTKFLKIHIENLKNYDINFFKIKFLKLKIVFILY